MCWLGGVGEALRPGVWRGRDGLGVAEVRGWCRTEAALGDARAVSSELGLAAPGGSKTKKPPVSCITPKTMELGTYLGHLLRQPQPVIPRVAAAPLSQQQAADAVARGVSVSYAELVHSSSGILP